MPSREVPSNEEFRKQVEKNVKKKLDDLVDKKKQEEENEDPR